MKKFIVDSEPVKVKKEFVDSKLSFPTQEVEVLFVSQKDKGVTYVGLKLNTHHVVTADGGDLPFKATEDGRYELPQHLTLGCEKGKFVF